SGEATSPERSSVRARLGVHPLLFRQGKTGFVSENQPLAIDSALQFFQTNPVCHLIRYLDRHKFDPSARRGRPVRRPAASLNHPRSAPSFDRPLNLAIIWPECLSRSSSLLRLLKTLEG